MLMIDEHLRADGRPQATWLDVEENALRVLVDDDVDAWLDTGVIDTVLDRYGRALDDGIALDGPQLHLGAGRILRRIRHRGRYDVIARDFLVLERPGRDPVAELATSVAAALTYLARAAATHATPTLTARA